MVGLRSRYVAALAACSVILVFGILNDDVVKGGHCMQVQVSMLASKEEREYSRLALLAAGKEAFWRSRLGEGIPYLHETLRIAAPCLLQGRETASILRPKDPLRYIRDLPG